MMNRAKLADKLVEYLEKRINCDNVIEHHDKFYQSTLGQGREASVDLLMVKNIPFAFKMMKYNATPGYVRENKSDPKDIIWVNNLFKTFDFMTEANYTGHPYFPYLYGVLDCPMDAESKLYIYYEAFEGDLRKLIDEIEHPSDWYDICFQMILINYYMEVVNNLRYNDGKPANHLYRKYSKPFYQKYQIEDISFSISHKYLIVLWDFNYVEKISDENRSSVVSNIRFLLKYLRENSNKIKILPSNRIMKLLSEIVNKPSDSIKILHEYYPQNKS